MKTVFLRDSCVNKHIYLVGSSPERNHDLYQSGMTTVCVNGSVANLPDSCGGECDILIVDNELLNEQTRNLKRSLIDQYKNIFLNNDYSTKILISSQSNEDPGGDPGELGINFEKYIEITKRDRLWNVSQALAKNTFLSEHTIHCYQLVDMQLRYYSVLGQQVLL